MTKWVLHAIFTGFPFSLTGGVMELAEAYNRLFGDDPSLATREALELFRANQDIEALDDEQFMNIAESAVGRYRSFAAARSLYVDSLDNPELKALLLELIEDEPTESETEPQGTELAITKPTEGTIDLNVLKTAKKGVPETKAAPKPETEAERDEGRVPYMRPVNPANLTGALAAAQTKGTKKTAMADQGMDAPSSNEESAPSVPMTIVVPPVVRNLNVPVWVQRLHGDEYYQMTREKTEEAFAQSRDTDPATRSQGRLHFAGWKRRASEQSQGCMGAEFTAQGNLLLKCAYDLQNGADPTSTDYIRFYVGP